MNPSLLAASVARDAGAVSLLALTTGLARGDDAAWNEFHRAYGPGIFRQLLAATHGDHDLASEALQQTYLRIARHAKPCDVETMFAAWLRIVARTALSDCRRRRMSFWQMLRRRMAEPVETDDEQINQAEDERLQLALDRALAALPADDRALLHAKYLASTPVREIAEQLGLSPKTIESRLTRARSTLRRKLEHFLSHHE